ncbi:uncharacterized protein LY79DRAFT_372080 [Colletotrichum navitas]|uniref:Secreted protein n=1 Tax=Colletotrichum navitas TaxID=681940 RepID=A0AAD8PQK4_9PEZI|nr:uncharacterized protein LY79DRAFT_372080 [Colletotrichum navitas]KAK1574158.1 hypothetical protein LY79DRAFT_372080 [Colletotrichum navitas]
MNRWPFSPSLSVSLSMSLSLSLSLSLSVCVCGWSAFDSLFIAFLAIPVPSVSLSRLLESSRALDTQCLDHERKKNPCRNVTNRTGPAIIRPVFHDGKRPNGSKTHSTSGDMALT